MEATETTTQPAAPAAQPNAEAAVDTKELIAKLEKATAQIEKLEADNFKYREKTRALKSQLPPEDAGEKAKAEQDRAAKIERATLKALIGKPIPSPEVADLLVMAAINSRSVMPNEDGEVDGLGKVLDRYLGMFAPPAPVTPPAPKTPDIARPGAAAEPVDPKFGPIASLADLKAKGQTAVLEFSIAYPDKFQQLIAADATSRRLNNQR